MSTTVPGTGDGTARRPGPGPVPGAGDGIDLAELRVVIDGLLDAASAGAVAADLPTDERADSTGVERKENLLEVTDEQVEALSAAHDALAEALSALDRTR